MGNTIIVVLLLVFIFQALTILLLEIKHPTKAVAWLFILFVFPIVGFVMYYFLAQEYQKRKLVRKKAGQFQEGKRGGERKLQGLDRYAIGEYQRLLGLLRHLPDSPITLHNRAEILTNGEPTFRSMLESIREAKDHIHLETYILRSDVLGHTFADELLRKLEAGVEVRVICDGVGSYHLKDEYVDRLKKGGAQFHYFLPPRFALFDKRINYRNHRKILVVDGRIGYIGGLNIGNEYLGGNKKLGFWRDTHLKLEGEAVNELQRVFLNDWRFASGKVLDDRKRYYPWSKEEEGHPIQVIASGPDAHWDTILEALFTSIGVARHRVWMTTPYFIPDDSSMMALKTAAASGVDVRVIFPKVPDSVIAHWASRSYVEELLQAGVRFYLYEKGFIHAKTFLADDMLASIGTANFDMRSFFSNFELNALLFDKSSIERLERDFLRDMEDSEEILLSQFERRSRFDRGKEGLARMLSPLL